MKSASRKSQLVVALIVGICLASSPLQADDLAAARDFTLKVLPLLKAKCFACHGDAAKEVRGALDVRSLAGLLKGGESGEPSLVPGDPEESLLFRAVKWDGIEMPPKENDRLTAAQVETIRQWIAAGAPWPGEADQRKHREAEWAITSNADGVIMQTSGGLADDWTYRRYKPEDVWAYRPIVKPELQPSQESSPIDSLVASRLAKAGITPASQADPRTLIRRATFDLIGLPPTPGEIQSFQAAWSQNETKAWEDLVNRLLSSPHYGERWAQHWFDTTRYADTGGMANDFERSNMWRYRDYVIRSFNDDKPYDRFVVEQLAGDELANESALNLN